MRIFRQRLLFSWSSMFHRKCLLRSIIIFTVFTSFMPLLIEGFPIPSWGSQQNSKALDPGAFPPYLQATKIEKPSCLRKARRSLNIKECSSLFEGKNRRENRQGEICKIRKRFFFVFENSTCQARGGMDFNVVLRLQ